MSEKHYILYNMVVEHRSRHLALLSHNTISESRYIMFQNHLPANFVSTLINYIIFIL